MEVTMLVTGLSDIIEEEINMNSLLMGSSVRLPAGYHAL